MHSGFKGQFDAAYQDYLDDLIDEQMEAEHATSASIGLEQPTTVVQQQQGTSSVEPDAKQEAPMVFEDLDAELDAVMEQEQAGHCTSCTGRAEQQWNTGKPRQGKVTRFNTVRFTMPLFVHHQPSPLVPASP